MGGGREYRILSSLIGKRRLSEGHYKVFGKMGNVVLY